MPGHKQYLVGFSRSEFLRKGDWLAASQFCSSTGSHLIHPREINDLDNKSSSEISVQEMWLGIKLTKLNLFYWLDGSVYEKSFRSHLSGDCFAINANQVEEERLDCWELDIWGLCHISECKICPPSVSSSCVKVKENCFVWSGKYMSWYASFSWCLMLGGLLPIEVSLKILPEVFQIMHHNAKRYYWIGLRNTDWVESDDTNAGIQNPKALKTATWHTSEPKKGKSCAIARNIRGSWIWFTELCDSSQSFVCSYDDRKSTEDISTTKTWKRNSTFTLNLTLPVNYKRATVAATTSTPSYLKVLLLILIVVLLTIPLTIIVPLLTYKRQKRHDWKKYDQQRSSSLLSSKSHDSLNSSAEGSFGPSSDACRNIHLAKTPRTDMEERDVSRWRARHSLPNVPILMPESPGYETPISSTTRASLLAARESAAYESIDYDDKSYIHRNPDDSPGKELVQKAVETENILEDKREVTGLEDKIIKAMMLAVSAQLKEAGILQKQAEYSDSKSGTLQITNEHQIQQKVKMVPGVGEASTQPKVKIVTGVGKVGSRSMPDLGCTYDHSLDPLSCDQLPKDSASTDGSIDVAASSLEAILPAGGMTDEPLAASCQRYRENDVVKKE